MDLSFGNRVLLLGPHGSGKSSLGRYLAQQGYEHLSVGTLARIARRGTIPSNVPLRLIMLLARHSPGQPLEAMAAKMLVEYANTRSKVVIDGFPGTAEHVQLLPDLASWDFVYVWTPRQLRHERLVIRSELTARKWNPGGRSARDHLLPMLCKEVRARTRLRFYCNRAANGDLAPTPRERPT